MKKTGEKPKNVKKDDKEQSRRFVETAKKLEADVTEKSFARAMGAIASDSQKKKDNQEPPR